MSFGSVMHNTIKYFIGELAKGHTLPFEEVERKFELEWTSAGFEDDYQEQEYKKDGLAQLRAFHASTLASPPDVIAQEKVFDLPMDNNVVLTGRMDQVNRLGPGEEEIVDYKTGKPRNEDKAKKDVQLSVYALAAREVFDWNPARLTLHFLQTNQPVSATRDDKQLKKVRAEIQEAAADIRAGEFPREARLLHADSATTNPSAPRESRARRPALPAKSNAARFGCQPLHGLRLNPDSACTE